MSRMRGPFPGGYCGRGEVKVVGRDYIGLGSTKEALVTWNREIFPRKFKEMRDRLSVGVKVYSSKDYSQEELWKLANP